jgi:hypothetical protein
MLLEWAENASPPVSLNAIIREAQEGQADAHGKLAVLSRSARYCCSALRDGRSVARTGYTRALGA